MTEEGTITIDLNPEDISSYSNFDKIIQKEMEIFASLDIKKKILSGSITTTYLYIDKNINYLVLDLKGPQIEKVEYIQNNNVYPLNFQIHEENEFKNTLGTPLIIFLPEFSEDPKPDYLKIKITFITKENSALQFIDKEQTFSKKYSFIYSQSKFIQCRNLFPCQDSPFAKVTIEANLEVEKPYKFLFSGIQRGFFYNSNTKKNNILYKQKIPIPTYLISFACGNFEYKKLSNRCGLYSEIGLIEKAEKEFEDIEKYFENIEYYLGSNYEWEIFNILILPFNFPFAGIENPNLTFISPSILSGDKSLLNILINEMIHSWTGNLLTNKNWKNYWINEGFCKFIERKVIGLIYGEEMENLEYLIGFENVIHDIEKLGEDSTFTSLNPDIYGLDPIDYYSLIPYEKGFQFLYYLQSLVGNEVFQLMIQIYIQKYKYNSIDYKAFKEVYEQYIMENTEGKDGEEILSNVDWDLWINSYGKPFAEFNFQSSLCDNALNLFDKFINGNSSLEDKNLFIQMNHNVKLYFLIYTFINSEKINIDVYKNIKNILGFEKDYYNVEIMNMWFLLGLKIKSEDCINGVKKFLLENGRLKFVKYLYFYWFDFQPNEAKDFFEKNKNIYHPIIRKIISNKFNNP